MFRPTRRSLLARWCGIARAASTTRRRHLTRKASSEGTTHRCRYGSTVAPPRQPGVDGPIVSPPRLHLGGHQPVWRPSRTWRRVPPPLANVGQWQEVEAIASGFVSPTRNCAIRSMRLRPALL